MDHITVPALQGPDSVIQVPYFFPQIDAIEEGEMPAGDGIEKFGF
jgi:hypothetical protein